MRRSVTHLYVGLAALAASTRLPQLSHLVFRGNPAEDPTPRISDDEMGMIHDIRYPASGRALEAKYGQRTWLSAAPRGIPRVEHF